jgi:hypothetical protein
VSLFDLLRRRRLRGQRARLQREHLERTCRRGYVRKHGRCVNNKPVRYGRSQVTIGAAGVHKLVIKPSARVRAALRHGKRLTVSLASLFTSTGSSIHFKESAVTKVHLLKRRKRHTAGH